MPVKIPDTLPAASILQQENIFVMTQKRANSQDIRPLRLGIINLMPTKIQTETQLLRLIGNTPLQIDITLIRMGSHNSKNTDETHLMEFYTTFIECKNRRFDGLIVTGAPVEQLPYEQVDYWPELVEILDWARSNVTSTLFICWGAQAALYRYYGIQKFPLEEKCFGVFPHIVSDKTSKLMRGFDDQFYVPHSRHTSVNKQDIQSVKSLKILAESELSGVYAIESEDGKSIFIMGHSEYDSDTLNNEYVRDISKGEIIKIPQNYYEADNPSGNIIVKWRAHSNLLFSNWLNYYVYQETPFEWE